MITPTNQQAKTAAKATPRPRGARSLPTLEACNDHPPDRRPPPSYQPGSGEATPITGWHGARVNLSNFIDTADVYENGTSEEVVGRAMKDAHRDELVLATKVRFPVGEEPPAGSSMRSGSDDSRRPVPSRMSTRTA
jgi:hypothetical protein